MLFRTYSQYVAVLQISRPRQRINRLNPQSRTSPRALAVAITELAKGATETMASYSALLTYGVVYADVM